MPPSQGYLPTADGIRLFFQTVGDGPKVVLFPNGIYMLEDFSRFKNGRTLVFYDVRNRGRSDSVDDHAKIANGIHHDVDDLEEVRRHFGRDRVAVVGHSYVGITVVLYAMKYAAHLDRVVQIGPMQPHFGKQYPPHLTCVDETFRRAMSGLAELEKERPSLDPKEFGRKFWAVLLPLYVTDPADVDRLAKWQRSDLPNELNLMKYWIGAIMPSIQRLNTTPEELAKVQTPVLTIHGTKDRSAPYGGGREWALELGNARLTSVENGGHGPWIESPERVFGAIETFLNGAWPEGAEKVTSLE